MNFESLCVREIEPPLTTDPHVLPIYASSSFRFRDIDQGISIFSGEEEGHVYGRYGNPTVEAVAGKIAAMEGFGLSVEPSGLLFSSGMSAISTLLLGCLEKGDKVLTQGNLYGGTTELFLKVFRRAGIDTIFTDLGKLDEVKKVIQEDSRIRMIFCESPANPTLACVDLGGLGELAREAGLLTAVDNTFCTPYLQQPLAYGIDFVVHSTTKYLNGHGNSIAGALVAGDPQRMAEQIWPTMKLAGTNCNPWDAWLVHNGMKTLPLRMDRHTDNALGLARFLEAHPSVERVNYTGLPSHPDFQLARKQMRKPGGMLSFEIKGGFEAGIRFMNRIRFCTLAPTLGDVDTLILHPASMSHVNVAPEIRQKNGITDGLIRVSVGIEHLNDLVNDLAQALEGE